MAITFALCLEYPGMKTVLNFPSAGSKFEGFWRGDSKEMERGR